MQNIISLLASTFGFTSTQGLTSTNVQSAIDEAYQKSIKLAGSETITGAKTFSSDVVFSNYPRLFAHRSSNTASMNQGVSNQIIMNAEEKDNQGIHNITTGTITIPSGWGGDYALKIHISIVVSSDATIIPKAVVAVNKNGSSYRDIGWNDVGALATSSGLRILGGIDLFDLAAGTTLDLRIAVTSNSSATFTIQSGSWISLHKIP